MFGIAGSVQFDGCRIAPTAFVEAMTGALDVADPGGGALETFGHAVLACRRSSMNTLADDGAPFAVHLSQGPVAIAWAGKLHNARQLRDELRAHNHRFRTSLEAEVVLRGHLQWAADLHARLDGTYAFAIWDEPRQQLTLVRDRLGVQPLFYQQIQDGLLFASAARAILAHPASMRIIDVDGIRAALAFTLSIPTLPWAGMGEVEPGTAVVVTKSRIATRAYWRLATKPHHDDAAETLARVGMLLEERVDRDLSTHPRPVVLCSGGLDSSLIAALACRSNPGLTLETCDVDFNQQAQYFVADAERSAPDSPYVKEVVAWFGTNHRTVELGPADVLDPALRSRAVHAYDLPPGWGDRDRSMYLLYRAVREWSTCALSGEAADEAFGGYATFHDESVQRTHGIPWIVSGYETYGPAPGALQPGLEAELDLHGYLRDEYARRLLEVEYSPSEDAYERRMRVISYFYLTRALRVVLNRAGRLSSAVGLELRTPFAEARLLEYAYNIPWSLKKFDGREKSLLRAFARELLPTSVINRVKTAYPSIRHPAYVAGLQRQASELGLDSGHAAFNIVNRQWLANVAERDTLAISERERNTLEWVLNLATWLQLYRPSLRLP